MSERILLLLEVLKISKTEFATNLKVTPAYVSKLINKGSTPSDRLIDDICGKYGVSENWLRTGDGEMFSTEAKDIEISKLLGDVLNLDQTDFKRRLVSALAKLDKDGWVKLEELIDSIAGK